MMNEELLQELRQHAIDDFSKDPTDSGALEALMALEAIIAMRSMAADLKRLADWFVVKEPQQ